MKILKASSFILAALALFASCTKEYSLEGVNIKVPVGSWQFKDSSKIFTGNIDTAYIDSAGNIKTLHLIGTSSAGDDIFSLLLFSSEDFKIGSYTNTLAETDFEYSSSVKTIYEDQLNGEFTVNITSIGNNKIAGTFSGFAQDSTGKIRELTLGKFSAIINLGPTLAAGTLGNTAGNCLPITPNGIYTQGVTLTSANTVQVQVNVTTPGTYSISTNTVNGVSFSDTGTFTTTGLKDVVLKGTGTPLNLGSQNFTVSFNASVCNFTIDFLPAPDYFPTTLNSNWTYGIVGGTNTDSVMTKVINYDPMFMGNTYSTITSNYLPFTDAADDSSYFRKSGGDYSGYVRLDSIFDFDARLYGEYIFLKDNVAQLTVWRSPDFSGTRGGVPATGYVEMTLLEKAVPATIGSQTFPDVIKVKYDYFYSLPPSPVATASEVRWFAKGVGLIYDELPFGDFIQLGSYQVF